MADHTLQTSVVTGAGSGIGRAIAHRLAADGFFVVVADRAEAAAYETVDQLKARGLQGKAAVLDITDAVATQRLIDDAQNLRVLVNNAGIFGVKPFDTLTADDFRKMFEINLLGMFQLSQQAARKLPKWGRIINICSRAAFGARNYAHYVASKAAVAGLTKALALDLSEKQITVNAVAPGLIQTDMLLMRSDLHLLLGQQPLGELGKPDDIAHAVAYFADPRANYTTGQILIVDGGRSIGGTAAF
jgi:3-oxoacyl-[acyl-carrier protein] reductase